MLDHLRAFLMKKIKLFAYYIILKRRFKSGYFRLSQIHDGTVSYRTAIKYHKQLVSFGYITPTKNGFRLRKFRYVMMCCFGKTFSIHGISETIKGIQQDIIDSLTKNKLRQQYLMAITDLASKLGKMYDLKKRNFVYHSLLSGKANAITSSRSIARELGISNSEANDSLNRLVKQKLVHIERKEQKITKHKIRSGIFEGERYVCAVKKTRFVSMMHLSERKLEHIGLYPSKLKHFKPKYQSEWIKSVGKYIPFPKPINV